jgi:hypothetical protein
MYTVSKKFFYIGIFIILGCFILILTILLIKYKHHSGTEKFTQLSEEGDSTYYTVKKSDSGNDCKADTLTQKCNVPGYGICTPSLFVCVPDGITCFENKESCELVTNCDKDSGWEKNADGSDCNVYKCTLDGQPATVKRDPKNNADHLYDYTYHRPNQDDSFPNDHPFCWRKNIGDPEPDIEQYCRDAGILGSDCYVGGIPTDFKLNDNWGGYDCVSHDEACTAILNDSTPLITGCPDGKTSDPLDCPTYMYPNTEYSTSHAATCWRMKSEFSDVSFPIERNNTIQFYTDHSYAIKGDRNTDSCQSTVLDSTPPMM